MESCIWESLITYLKLSKLNPKRVRGIHNNPKIILGREPNKNEDVYFYWVELNDKVYSIYGIIDLDIWNNKYKDYNKEYGNEHGLLKNELEQFSEPLLSMIIMIYNEKDINKKKASIKILEKIN
jgi:hypothetical protein